MAQFEVGDKVFSALHGEGEVIEIRDDDRYSVLVKVNNNKVLFTSDGRHFAYNSLPVLFHRDVTDD